MAAFSCTYLILFLGLLSPGAQQNHQAGALAISRLSWALTSPPLNYCQILFTISSPSPLFLNPSSALGILVHGERGLYYKTRELGWMY